MYYYIFDAYLNDPAYETQVQDINATLNDLTVQGERARVSPLRRLPDIMRDAFAKKIDTIVVIGNEESLAKSIGYALDYNLTLGYFPVDPEDPLGSQLGLGNLEECGKALSARRVEKIYPIKLNERYFLTHVTAGLSEKPKRKMFSFLESKKPQDFKILFDENYFVSGEFEECTIYNVPEKSDNPLVAEKRIIPYDQTFEVAFKARLPKFRSMRDERGVSRDEYKTLSPYNLLKAKKIEILEPKGIEFRSNGSLIGRSPAVVEAADKKLSLIVGRDRRF